MFVCPEHRLPRLARYLHAVFIVSNFLGKLNKLELELVRVALRGRVPWSQGEPFLREDGWKISGPNGIITHYNSNKNRLNPRICHFWCLCDSIPPPAFYVGPGRHRTERKSHTEKAKWYLMFVLMFLFFHWMQMTFSGACKRYKWYCLVYTCTL